MSVMAQQTVRPVMAHSPSEVLGARSATRLLLALAVALGVLTIAVAAHWQPLIRLDHAVARDAFQSTKAHPVLAAWWHALGYITEPIILRVLMAVAGLLLLWRGRRFLGGWLVAVAVLEQLVGPYAKYVLDRPRPHWPHPLEVLDTTSYPAGHATGIACFATAVVLLTLSLSPGRPARGRLFVLAGLLVGLVCADRLFLGLHYLSDVVAGALLGVATTVVCWIAALLVGRRGRTDTTAAPSGDRSRKGAHDGASG
jgi:membrane-associated phospholipid phosphatase